MKNASFFLVLVIIGLTLSGCATVNKRHRDRNAAAADHAILSIHESVMVVSINGRLNFSAPKMWMIPSGEQSVGTMFRWDLGNMREYYQPLANENAIKFRTPITVSRHRSVLSSETVAINFNFEPGRHYFLYAPSDRTNYMYEEIVIVDETDPASAWGTTRIRDAERRVEQGKRALR